MKTNNSIKHNRESKIKHTCIQLIFRKAMKAIPIWAQLSTNVLESASISVQTL